MFHHRDTKGTEKKLKKRITAKGAKERKGAQRSAKERKGAQRSAKERKGAQRSAKIRSRKLCVPLRPWR
ncbi:MAG TPA: hypothetical protein ENK51_10150 [Gammaproteobacteria bacterium]|nr:hypothetical protein [Gammaproteobacteria bacterium]